MISQDKNERRTKMKKIFFMFFLWGFALAANAITTTSYNYIRDTPKVSVMKYAKGDGSTDDTESIQRVLSESSGKVVFFPKGTYKIKSLMLPENTTIEGAGVESVILAAAPATSVIRISNNGCTVKNIMINGGGQTTGLSAGIAETNGITIEASNIVIEDVWVKKCGIVNSSNPTDDSGYGAFGIILNGWVSEAIENVKITRCVIEDIAGGGNYKGDAIYIGGQAGDRANIVIDSCTIKRTGRQGIALVSDSSLANNYGVTITNCYFEDIPMAGIDPEPAKNVIINNCVFNNCGRYTGYYDVYAIYGSTFRLCAGIAHDNTSKDILISNCIFEENYYGVTWGAGPGLTLTDCVFSGSILGDVGQTLAGSPRLLKVSNCDFKTNIAPKHLIYASESGTNTIFENCSFAFLVNSGASPGQTTFKNCLFKNNFSFTLTNNKNYLFDGCSFVASGGAAISAMSADRVTNLNIVNCGFYGMQNGIHVFANAAFDISVVNCFFDSLTSCGILQELGLRRTFSNITNNRFSNCPVAIYGYLGGYNNCIITNNKIHNSTTGIKATGVSTNNSFEGNIISNNIISSTSLGLELSVSSGINDFNIITNNIFYDCATATAITGNASSTIANNIEY